MRKILRLSRRVRTGSGRSRLVTLFLLCSSCFLLSFNADDYAECTDPLPDEVLDVLGLIRIPEKDPVLPFIFILLLINPALFQNNSMNLLAIDLAITTIILASTVIRI